MKLGFLERPSRLAVEVDVNMDGMVKRKVGELQRERALRRMGSVRVKKQGHVELRD